MNRKYFFGLFLLALPAFVFAQDLLVTKVVVVGASNSEAPWIQRQILEVQEGHRYSAESLKEAAGFVHRRLLAPGYFASVDVQVIVSKREPGTAHFIVEITDGYPNRFSGGPYFASTLWGNLGGSGLDLGLTVGWNTQSVGLVDHHSGWNGGSWSVEGGNRPRSWVDAKGNGHEDHALGGSATISQDWGWGWTTSVGAGLDKLVDESYASGSVVPQAKVGLQWSNAEPVFSPPSGLTAQLTSVVFGTSFQNQTGADVRFYQTLFGPVKGALRVAAARQTGAFAEQTALNLSGLDGVRKAWDPSDLNQSELWSSAELRWTVLTLPLAGFTKLIVEPAMIADAGIVFSTAGPTLSWSRGIALRVDVAAPVDVPVRLELTWDELNRATWFFGIENPF